MQNEEEMNLFFGLTKTDISNISEIFIITFFMVFIISIVALFVAYVLGHIFEKNKDSLGLMAFALGTAAFIPIFGLMYGIAGVIWGLVTDKKNGKVLAGFSATGAILNIALIAAPFIVIWAGIPD